MFSIFNKKKKIKIDIFTYDEEAFQYAPIKPAQHYIPDWWKKLPTKSNKFSSIEEAESVMGLSGTGNQNMKRCFGFVELFKTGFILPSWSDLNFTVNDDTVNYNYARGRAPGYHNSDQFSGAFTDFNHVKLVAPWYIKEKTGIKFLFKGDPWNNHNQKFHIVDGIMRYDVATSTNINMMFPRLKYTYESNIRFGDPLVHIIPLVEDDVEIEHELHLTTIEECKYNLDYLGMIRVGGPYNTLKFLNKSKKHAGKCPF